MSLPLSLPPTQSLELARRHPRLISRLLRPQFARLRVLRRVELRARVCWGGRWWLARRVPGMREVRRCGPKGSCGENTRKSSRCRRGGARCSLLAFRRWRLLRRSRGLGRMRGQWRRGRGVSVTEGADEKPTVREGVLDNGHVGNAGGRAGDGGGGCGVLERDEVRLHWSRAERLAVLGASDCRCRRPTTSTGRSRSPREFSGDKIIGYHVSAGLSTLYQERLCRPAIP